MRRPLQGVRTKRGGGSLCRRRRKPLQAAAAVFRVGSGRSNDFARAGDRVSEGICVFYPFSKLFLCFNQRKTSKEGANEFFGLRNQGIRTDPKTEGNSVVRLENRGSGAIAP
jgi:hypothetical protein